MRFKSTWGSLMRIVFSIFFLAVVFPHIAFATQCFPPANVISESPIIFKGKAVTTTELPSGEAPDEKRVESTFGNQAVTKFEVQEVYKGKVGSEVDVYHLIKGITSVSYADGMTYVIFTDKDNKNDGNEGKIETGLCSPRLVLEEKEHGPYYNDWPDFERQLKAYVGVGKSFENLLKENPDNPYVYFQQAEFFEANNDYLAAEAAWRKGITARAALCVFCSVDKSKLGADTDFDSEGNQLYVGRYVEVLKKQGKNEEAQRILDGIESRRLQQYQHWKKRALERKSKTEQGN